MYCAMGPLTQMNRLFKGFFFSRYAAAAEWCYVNKVLTCLFFRYSGILYLGNLHIGKAIRGSISYHTFNYFNTCTDNPGKVNWQGAKGLSPSSSSPRSHISGGGAEGEQGRKKSKVTFITHQWEHSEKAFMPRKLLFLQTTDSLQRKL